MVSVRPVLCWSLSSVCCGERGLEVSLQGPALALRRQGAGTRQLKFVLPALGIYRLVQHYRHATLCYDFYFTRLSRPTESRDWGEARGQSRARAGTSLDGILQCTLRNRPDCNGEYRHIHPARSAGPDTAVPGPVFSGPPSTYVCTCTCCNQAAHALTASEERIHPCPWIHAPSDACGGRYPASWASS